MPHDFVALRYAVLSAETLSFARAAALSGVKQATLSKRIGNLETRLGLKLFERSTRGAVPTEAGIGFIDAAGRLLADLDTLFVRGRALGAGYAGSLGIGFSTSIASGNIRALAIELVGLYPELNLVGVEGDRSRLSQSLHAGTVDFAVISGDVLDIGLERRAMWSERVMALLPEQHALANKDRIYWPDLRKERFVLPRQDPGPDFADLVAGRLSEPGWRPKVETQEVSRENVMNMVSLGRFITLTTDTSLGRTLPGTVLREIHEMTGHVSHIAFAGYWRSDNTSPALQRLLTLLRDRYPD